MKNSFSSVPQVPNIQIVSRDHVIFGVFVCDSCVIRVYSCFFKNPQPRQLVNALPHIIKTHPDQFETVYDQPDLPFILSPA